MGRGRDDAAASTWRGSRTTTCCGKPEPEPVDLQHELWWAFFAKDLSVSLQMARRRELTPAGFVRPYLQRHKVRGVFAADDPLPALGVLAVRPLEDR